MDHISKSLLTPHLARLDVPGWLVAVTSDSPRWQLATSNWKNEGKGREGGRKETHVPGVNQVWVQIPALLLFSCIALGCYPVCASVSSSVKGTVLVHSTESATPMELVLLECCYYHLECASHWLVSYCGFCTSVSRSSLLSAKWFTKWITKLDVDNGYPCISLFM